MERLQRQSHLQSELDALRARLARVVLITMTSVSVTLTIASAVRFILQLFGMIDQSVVESPFGGLGTLTGGLTLRYLYLKILPVRLNLPP